MPAKVYLISDTHFNHTNIATYCDRPGDFTERIIKNWAQVVKADDLVIHLGDVFIGKADGWDIIWPRLTGKKTLIRGNHDRNRSPTWWLQHGFDSVNDGVVFRRCNLSHEPLESLSPGCILNIHGHLHNVWDGFQAECLVGPEAGRLKKELKHPWQRLFAVEYTEYRPVEFDKFVSQPDKYQSRGKEKYGR